MYRLGNLTLLEPPVNRAVGNADYPTKQAAYRRSVYVLTQEIAETAPHEWTPAHLDARQRRLATRATHVWRVGFA